MDAQAYGSSAAYANYVFGVYLAAAGYTLADALSGANLYAAGFANYNNRTMDPNYPSIPAANANSITAGYNDQLNGLLCVLSQ